MKLAIQRAFEEHAIGQSTVSKVWITEQFSAVQQSLSEKINVVNNLLSAGGVAVQGNINGRFGRSNLPMIIHFQTLRLNQDGHSGC